MKNYKFNFLICFFHITYLLTLFLYFYLNDKFINEILLVVISIMFYVLSLLSFIFPKFSHHLLYKWGELVLKSSGERIEYEKDNFKKYIKYRYLFLVFAFAFILMEIFINIF